MGGAPGVHVGDESLMRFELSSDGELLVSEDLAGGSFSGEGVVPQLPVR
jgi:hypothetical protein